MEKKIDELQILVAELEAKIKVLEDENADAKLTIEELHNTNKALEDKVKLLGAVDEQIDDLIAKIGNKRFRTALAALKDAGKIIFFSKKAYLKRKGEEKEDHVLFSDLKEDEQQYLLKKFNHVFKLKI